MTKIVLLRVTKTKTLYKMAKYGAINSGIAGALGYVDEESILDSKFLDYSMVLQCSNSYYGYLNDNKVSVNDNILMHNLDVPLNFINFNSLFCDNLNKKDMQLIKVLEATQFFRMLPFKVKSNDLIKAKYFYVHGCMLLGEVFK